MDLPDLIELEKDAVTNLEELSDSPLRILALGKVFFLVYE
jgi:flagellar motor switch/type III secretory pathway protein FliN